MNSQMSSSLHEFTFSDEQLLSLCETSEALACVCPVRLATLLWETRRFYHYTQGCIDRFPEEAEMHRQLGKKIHHMDAFLSQILVEFLQSKDLLNDQQHLDLKLLKQRQIEAIQGQYHSLL